MATITTTFLPSLLPTKPTTNTTSFHPLPTKTSFPITSKPTSLTTTLKPTHPHPISCSEREEDEEDNSNIFFTVNNAGKSFHEGADFLCQIGVQLSTNIWLKCGFALARAFVFYQVPKKFKLELPKHFFRYMFLFGPVTVWTLTARSGFKVTAPTPNNLAFLRTKVILKLKK